MNLKRSFATAIATLAMTAGVAIGLRGVSDIFNNSADARFCEDRLEEGQPCSVAEGRAVVAEWHAQCMPVNGMGLFMLGLWTMPRRK